jgi:Ca-activated chloride channel family protein
VFSEIDERAPLDPWARKRLGDLYRAHGWFDDAYREYSTLARLRPADPGVLLDLARAAAGAGRIDEALRLEQRLSESSADEHAEGPAEFARLWTKIRLARLKLDGPAALAPIVQQRERETGALRDPPALLAMLSWMHPDDEPELHVGYPGVPEEDREWERAPLQGGAYGVEAVVARVREPGEYRFEVRRQELDRLRDVTGELMVITHPGTGDERILRVPVTLSRTARAARFRLTDRDALEIVEIPAE